MNCQDVAMATPDYLTGDLDSDAMERVQAHLAECGSCREEIEGLSETWARLGVLPEELPGPSVREGFYAMLEGNVEDPQGRLVPGRQWRGRSTGWSVSRWLGLAAALVAGVGVGFSIKGTALSGRGADLSRMSAEIDSLRQQVSLALIGQSSAGERLKGVALVSHVKQPETSLLTGLLDIVDNDPNVNVRLSAVDALYLFASHPQIREGLTHALGAQTSPVVQIALIDLLVAIREKHATEALRQLVEDQRVRPEVRERARSGIEKLL